MKKFFCFTTLLCSLLADLLIGNSGFSISLTISVLLYIAGTLGIKTALLLAVLMGCFTDMIYARPETFSTVVFPLAVGAGCYFMPRKELRYQLYRSLLSGAVAGSVFVLGNAVAAALLFGQTGGYPSSITSQIAGSVIFGICSFPLLILGLDCAAAKVNLPGYLTKLPADVANLDKPEISIETASGRRRKK